MDLSKITEIRQKQEVLRQQLKEESKSLFGEAAKELFVEHPIMDAFTWTQYTPYFNDGDECVFRVNDVYVSFKGSLDGVKGVWVEDERDDKGFCYVSSREAPSEYVMAAEAVGSFVNIFGEDVLKDMFGDHCEITVYPDRVDVDSYEHD